MKIPVALELYSVRDETQKDFIGALEKVAGIGYKGVEFAGFGDIPAARLRKALAGLGLEAAGSHTDIRPLTDELDEVIEYNQALGNHYIVCPCMTFESKEDIARTSELFNKIGEKIRAGGLEFLYHNHAHEFKRFDGEYGLDLLFKGVEPENMGAEVDTGWAFYAGADPAGYIGKYKGRCPLIHVKDFTSAKDGNFTEIGAGAVNVRAIAAAAAETGVRWIIVEQDESSMPSLESVGVSFANLRKMDLV